MNVADAEEVKASLKQQGYQELNEAEHAEVVILNSCAIRETSEERVYGRLAHYGAWKKKRDLTLVLMGCVAQKERDRVLTRAPYVDMVVGTHYKTRFPNLLSEYREGRNLQKNSEGEINPLLEQQSKVYGKLGEYRFNTAVPSKKYPFKADLTVIHGCNKYCTYCIVPYTRGVEMSRSSKEIVENVYSLVDQGVSEICLLGQNVNSYGQDTGDLSFSELLCRLNEVDRLKRIRFLTSHPMDFTDDLIQSIVDCEKVCHYVHLPIQSASDRVLAKMRRDYSYDHYRYIIQKLRERIPDVVLSTDILLGFPYETEEDFEKTLSAVSEIRYDHAYMFQYSRRRGAESENYPDLPAEEKKRRLALVIQTQHAITREKNQEGLGKIEEVLLEGVSKNNPEELIGKTEGNKPVVVRVDESELGKYKNVVLKSLKGNTFIGELID